MDILIKAFEGLFPDRSYPDTMTLKYSRRFKGYNANLRYRGSKISFALSSEWEKIDDDIKIGLIQHLLVKVYKTKRSTYNMDLYENFLRNVHIAIPKDKQDPYLKQLFHELNDRFFNGLLEESNLVWGHNSFRTFGSYDYGTDTITLNPALKTDEEVLRYVLFHEMLHKKLKFRGSRHHTKEFRKIEKSYPDSALLEKKLGKLSRKLRFRSSW